MTSSLPNNCQYMTKDSPLQVYYSIIQKSSYNAKQKESFQPAQVHLYALFVHGITVIAFVIWVIVHAQLASCMQNRPICTCCLNYHLNYDISQLCACKYEQKKKDSFGKQSSLHWFSVLNQSKYLRPVLLTLETLDVSCIWYRVLLLKKLLPNLDRHG